jgi:hypothetical protein
MNDFLKSALREAAQKLVGIVAVWVVAHGVPVPDAVTNWAVLTLIAGGVALWTIAVRFLETRTNPVARFLARMLMLGIGSTPTYAKPVEPAPKPEPVL